jgi:hypothetical protein
MNYIDVHQLNLRELGILDFWVENPFKKNYHLFGYK